MKPFFRLSTVGRLLLLVACFNGFTAASIQAKDESVGAVFLSEAVGTRPTAMGGAFTAVADDMNAIYWNSAGLVRAKSIELLVTHTEFIQDFRNEYFAFGLPVSQQDSVGFNAYLSYTNSLEKLATIYDNPSTYSAYDTYLTAAWSHAWDANYSTGLSLKGVYQVIDTYSAWSVAADLCGLARDIIVPNFAFGLVIRNLGLPMKFISQGYALPMAVEAGAAYTLLDKQLLVTFDMVKPFQQELLFKCGAEYNLEEMLFFRAGYKYYQYGNDLGPLSGLTLGLGAEITDYKVEYTYAPYTDLGDIHRISVTFPLGRSTVEEEKIINRMEKKLAERQQKLIQGHIQHGDHQVQEKQYQAAIHTFEKALALAPDDPAIKTKINAARQLLTRQTLAQHYQAGKSAFKKGEYVNALIEFNRVIELNPAYQDIQKLIASANTKLEHFQAAQIVSETEQKIQKFVQKGIGYIQRGKYRLAIRQWDQALKINSKLDNIRGYIVNARRKMKEEIDKYLSDAEAYHADKNLPQAVVLWRKVLDIDPENLPAQSALKSYSGEISEMAAELYKKGLQNYVSNEWNRAIANWKNVLILEPDNEKAMKNLERAEEKLKYIRSLDD